MSEIIEHTGCRIEIWQDEGCENPREWDNLGTMVCFHRRYELGNKHDYGSSGEYSGWEEIMDAICEREGPCVYLPVYMYEHGGVVLNTGGFSCPWDSGQIGWIFVREARVKEEWLNSAMTPDERETAALNVLRSEVENYSQYLNGECYGYTLTCDGVIVESVGGFIGWEDVESEAKQQAEYYAEQAAVSA